MSHKTVFREGYWSIVWRHFRRNRLALAGLVLVVALIAVALLADFLANDRPLLLKDQGKLYFPVIRGVLVDLGVSTWPEKFQNTSFKSLAPEIREQGGWVLFPPIPFSPNDYSLLHSLEPPTPLHWMGTDETGRDIASRMIHGSRISLSVGLVAVSIYVVIGVILGSLAGYYGGWVDIIVSRLIELMITFPTFFLIITIVAFLPPSIYNIMVVLGLTGWASVARLVRGEFLRIKSMDFVTAARALGFPPHRIIFRHVLPNALAPVFVSATFGIAGAILTESSLSFLGFGVPPSVASWGSILSNARELLPSGWWVTLFPGLAIFITITVYNLVGEGFRDAMDPRLYK